MRVLVSGADGFAGSHLVRGLRAAGHEVTSAVFARDPQPGEVRVDITRPSELEKLSCHPEAVVHAAGIVTPHAGTRTMFAVNAGGTENLVRWARTRGVRHFVHLSSVAVYGPLVLGEDRDENTPRLGLNAGFAYMRSKARAERAVERSGLPYTLLRPPAIVGAGDTVISQAFVRALQDGGYPLLKRARMGRRVSLAFAEGLADVALRALERGPLHGAVHVVHAELSVGELAQVYANVLRQRCTFAPVTWPAVMLRGGDAGYQWLVASARFGQHYSRRRLVRELGYSSSLSLESAVTAGISGLQGP
jgi:nucleoside-diphosphate-sugar epimerase